MMNLFKNVPTVPFRKGSHLICRWIVSDAHAKQKPKQPPAAAEERFVKRQRLAASEGHGKSQ